MEGPELVAEERFGVRWLTDRRARAAGVLVAFCDRRGGFGRAPFDTLNLAARVGDDPAAVERNRAQAARAVGFDLGRLALARQVHGAEVMQVDGPRRGIVGRADGLATDAPGTVLGMLTADCAAVVILGRPRLAIVHAGWRGLVAGVIERGVEAVAPARAAWVGPCIRSCCYEVGPEVVAAFRARGFPTAGSRRVDIAEAAGSALGASGVQAVALSDECTACSERYFSYRRDGVTGRQGAFAALFDGASPDGAA